MQTQTPVVKRVRSYRQRMAEQGMRQINLWVPDIRSPRIAEEARRQSLLVSQGETEDESAWMDAALEDMAGDDEWTD